VARIVAAERIDRVAIAFGDAGHEELLRCLRACRASGVPVDVVPRLFEFVAGARLVDRYGGLPLMALPEPKASALAVRAKRALDVAGALAGLLLLAPVLAAVAVAIKLDSPGPVLFRQRRGGRGGRMFVLYKFRTMRPGSVVRVRADGAIEKRGDDDRLTRVGRRLRRLSLDEAPQLLNVLKGDMSLVGPRPLVEAELATLSEEWQRRRGAVRPGLTGAWQVSGRSDTPLEDMIRIDFQYVTGWSPARDLEILLATVGVVLSGRGAY
jgi:exopolysaccharide biosynthesis polyprenyl glycosylphosphotransferase